MSWLRNELPLLEKYIYADTPASGLLCAGLLEWRRLHDREYHEGGSPMKAKSFGLLPQTRESLGAFFDCPADRVALTPNFSLGLNLLLDGLDAGKSVLLVKNDYPSVNWPFEQRGFQVHYVACDSTLEERILQTLESRKIDILALSLVQWINGVMISPRFLSELKKNYPELLVIADGTQYCGAFSLDFRASGIDVLGASGYKWLLGGYGNAFYLFSEAAAGFLNPRSTGFNAAGWKANRQQVAFPRHLEPGHLDSLNFGSLKLAIEMLHSIGIDNIETHNRMLSEHFKKGLWELDLLEPLVFEREAHSSIFNIRGKQPLFDYLSRHKVVCSQRGQGLRVGFHLYNTISDVERIVELLSQWKG
jgi:selenocysteine lyase/cysteine desulfurase